MMHFEIDDLPIAVLTVHALLHVGVELPLDIVNDRLLRPLGSGQIALAGALTDDVHSSPGLVAAILFAAELYLPLTWWQTPKVAHDREHCLPRLTRGAANRRQFAECDDELSDTLAARSAQRHYGWATR